MKKIFFLVFALLQCTLIFSQYQPKALSLQYTKMNENLARGWNTWNGQNILSHVLLPEGFSINLSFKAHWNFYLDKGFQNINRLYEVNKILPKEEGGRTWANLEAYNRPEHIKPGLRADDGSYTSLIMEWNNMNIDIQTATEGNDWLAIITVKNAKPNNSLVVEAGMMWNHEGFISKNHESIKAKLPGRTITVNTTNKTITDNNVPCNNMYLVIELTDNEIGLYTGKPRTLTNLKQIIEARKQEQLQRADKYGELSNTFKAVQQSLTWNTIYDAENDRVISPVSRLWCAYWGGWMLFDWDNYFASYMFSMFNKELAYSNAIHITKSITDGGFIPNYAKAYSAKSYDRSQPPVGSIVVREIYRKYKEKWFLEELYDELLTWNRWWPKARDNNGSLCWGSNPNPREEYNNSWQGAAFESGLDNAPMFDNVPFNSQTHLMELTDVGLMSLYITDCEALADISTTLDRNDQAKELTIRAEKYKRSLASHWNDTSGIYLNKRTDIPSLSYRLSPTNFYPLISGLPDSQKAKRMIQEHYFNPQEFYGEYVMPSCARNDVAYQGDYWRGRIWGPMNFLVYLGLTQYDGVADAREDLVHKSNKLLLKSWMTDASIFENYCSETGKGENSLMADSYYHWGALLGFMSFIEKGFVPKPLITISK